MVSKATTKLKSSFSAGPDGFPSAILKRCSTQLLIPLVGIFNQSLSSGFFPSKWEKSFMFTFYKKGDRSNVQHYSRIISLCSVSKLLQIVVKDYLFFHCKNYFSDEQHWFYPGRSSTSNLLLFTSNCFSSIENELTRYTPTLKQPLIVSIAIYCWRSYYVKAWDF